MDIQTELLEYIKRVRALSKVGLTYSQNSYDIERYEELVEKSHEMLQMLSNLEKADFAYHFKNLDDYPTPKVDVRGVVIQNDQILLIREKADGKWAMPGGWADIGYSPSENIVKEVWEEAGFEVKVSRLLAVWDKAKHDHPHDINYVYKLQFHCEVIGGTLNPGHETLGAAFFPIDELPELSLERNTPSQVRKLFELVKNGGFSLD